MDYHLARATPTDVPAMWQLIRELAEYEKGLHELTLTPAQLYVDGFGTTPPRYQAWLAHKGSDVVGMALYFLHYSSWQGSKLYLEDLIITAAHRGKGLGKALLQQLLQEATSLGCVALIWQVLDWNTPAIRFYESLKASLDPQWINCSLQVKQA